MQATPTTLDWAFKEINLSEPGGPWIPGLGKQREEDGDFEDSLGCIRKPCLKLMETLFQSNKIKQQQLFFIGRLVDESLGISLGSTVYRCSDHLFRSCSGPSPFLSFTSSSPYSVCPSNTPLTVRVLPGMDL